MRLLVSAAPLGPLDPVSIFLRLITGLLAHTVDTARTDIQNALQRYLFSTVDVSATGIRSVTANPALRQLNFGVGLMVDAMVGATFTFACIRSIFERSLRSHYSMKIMIPRLLCALVFAHFSLPLLQMAIDLNNALGYAALHLGANLTVDTLPWSPSMSPAEMYAISISQNIFHALFAIAVVLVLVILAFTYVVRYALLQVLIVFAPLAALCMTLNDTRSYARTWLRLFLVTVFMQATQLLILRVAATMALHDAGFMQSLYALATLYILLKVPGALNTSSHLETKAKTLGHHWQSSVHKALHPAHHAVRKAA